MTAPTTPGPIPNSYWLVHGELLAGGYPGSSDAASARKKLEAILSAGVRIFVDLTQPDELPPYDIVLEENARDKQLDVRYRRISIRDMDVPTVEVMQSVLSAIREEAAAGRPVYVHCWGGVGRTGTVIGCWLVEQGHTCDEALERIRILRLLTPEAWKRSPETNDQRSFVRGWGQTGVKPGSDRGQTHV